jgi:hypothetical protein
MRPLLPSPAPPPSPLLPARPGPAGALLLALLSACAAPGDGAKGGAGGGPDTAGGGPDSGGGGGADGGAADGGDGGGDGGGPTATSLRCDTDVVEIASVWDAPGEATFTATGAWSDGREEDVTATATWSVADGPGGEVTAGRYVAAPRGAGPVTLRVEWEGLEATCGVDTRLDAVVNLTGDPAIEAAVAAAGARADADCAPYVLYPLDQSLIPADFFSPDIQWVPEAGQDLFVIRFETTWITLTAITQGTSWVPSGDEWWAVADPGAGREIDLSVLGGDWDAGAAALTDGLCGSPWPTAFETERWGAPGAVFYWTPTYQGIWQIEVGASAATPWMDVSTTGRCVGCHSVNHANPSRFVAAMDGGYGPAWVAEADAPTVAVGGGGTAAFTALNPTGDRLVRSLYGTLQVDEVGGATGLYSLPTRGWASHPTWSPDGAAIVYSSCGSAAGSQDWQVYDCDLRRIEVLGTDSYGADSLVAEAPPGQSFYYPTFSPDSRWIAFNRSTNGAAAYANTSAELMLVDAAGGAPVLLAQANGLPNVENSWPRWGPIVGDIGWIAYSSERAYANRVIGVPQVWVTGVDLGQVAAGEDGSHAPVWLPGQSTSTGNHTPSFLVTQPE